VAADRPFYSGKHRRHGMNLQVIATPGGEIVWVSGPLPGAVHDLTAARIWGIIRELAACGLVVLADKGYHGAGDPVRTPYRGRGKPASQKDANRAHAQLRSPAERANAQLKTWRILRKLCCCPWRAGQLAKAIHVLQAREIAGRKRFTAVLRVIAGAQELLGVPPLGLGGDQQLGGQAAHRGEFEPLQPGVEVGGQRRGGGHAGSPPKA
jgi:hypothetical protein